MSRASDNEPAGDSSGPFCWNCNKPLDDLARPVSRHQYCPHCAEAVHCCRMCTLFAPTRPEQCREDRAEPPTDKTAANFCDLFILRETAPGSPAGGDEGSARARLDALFGSGSGEASGPDAADHDDREARARSRLDDLFGGDSDGD